MYVVLMYAGFLYLHAADAADLTVTVENIQMRQGSIRIALFTETMEFPDPSSSMRSVILSADKPAVTTTFDDLVPNDYAIAVYHDVNDNGQLDRNFLGIPKEPYGFSNNVKRLSPPGFDEAKVTLGNDDICLRIKLR
jgi:uncharacterized protein (DUF2141 family)